MKVMVTHYDSLVPESEKQVFVGPYRILEFAEQFLRTRGFERNRNVPAPIGSICVILWCIIVTNICSDINLRNEVRSILLNNPLHDIISFVDGFFPVNGRTPAMGNFPIKISATTDAVDKVRTLVNNGSFIKAVNFMSDYMNLAGIVRSTASPDIINSQTHSALTAIHVDTENVFPTQVDENVKFLTLNAVLNDSGKDYDLLLPHAVTEVEVYDKGGNVVISKETNAPLVKFEAVDYEYYNVPFYTQSTDKSGFSTSKPVLVSFASFLICTEKTFETISYLLSLKMGYTFTLNEQTNAMYQLINNSYGPAPTIKEPEDLNPERATPQLPKLQMENFQEPGSRKANPNPAEDDKFMYRPQLPPNRSGGRGSNSNRRRNWKTRALPVGRENSQLDMSGYGPDEIKLARLTLLVFNMYAKQKD